VNREKSQAGLGIDHLMALVLVLILFVVAWIIWIAPRIGANFLVTMITTGTALLFVLALTTRLGLRQPNLLHSFRFAWPAFVAPIVGGGSLVISALRWEGMPDWALQGDMVWNTATALFINSAGGVVFETHANPAPLTNAILALFYGLDPSFAAVLRGNATVIIVTLVLSSIISGFYSVRMLNNARPLVRFLIIVAVGWLPFTAIALDGVFRLGLANVLVSYLALWIVWVIYMSRESPWHHRVSLLLLSAVVLLASWAPLAVIPCVLFLVVMYEDRNFWLRDWKISPKRFLVPIFSLIQLMFYVLLVTLPDLNKAGSHLGANGAYPPLDASEALVIILIITLIAVNSIQLLLKQSEGWRMAAGTIAVLLAAVLVFIYLVGQRGAGESFWGYYPIKFVSLIIFLFTGISVVTIASYIRKQQPLYRQLVIGTSAIPLYLIAILAPMQWAMGSYTFGPTLVAAVSPPSAERLQAISDLVTVEDADLDGIELFVKWNPNEDAFVNSYLFQLAVERGDDPIRGFAYTFDPSIPSQFCEVLKAADQPVTVFTHLDEGAFLNSFLRGCENTNSLTVSNQLPSRQ
jgi:hypothetical protein